MQDIFKDIIIHLTDEHTFAADVPKAGGLYTSELKGIAPIMIKLKDDRRFFEGAVVADRYIGKAAAMLLIDSGAKAIFGQVVSEHAVCILEASGIIWEAETTVPYIINRKKDGMCPMEKAVLNETDVSNAFEILKKRQNEMKYADVIEQGKTALGIELGSTRIKAVLTDEEAHILATGSFGWENKLENGLWTYSLEDIYGGLKACYKDLKAAVKEKYGVTLTKISKMGISAMMHGLMAFDAGGNLLVPFRTWRNTNTTKGAEYLTKLFNFNIPLRWSVAHLGTALLDNEPFVEKLDYMTTLAGFIHWQLTGEKVIGVGDASGMFPIDSETADYNQKMIDAMEEKMALPKPLRELFPKVLKAGEAAGILTEAGAKLLDEEGDLSAGSRLCPPEGDAGTG
ncbi:MAG: DUF1893 domain-containing protein, partial [Parasporobacterium sp.]|nr:DUF1893 domain-containing protein [Parasporobacterium sp.]